MAGGEFMASEYVAVHSATLAELSTISLRAAMSGTRLVFSARKTTGVLQLDFGAIYAHGVNTIEYFEVCLLVACCNAVSKPKGDFKVCTFVLLRLSGTLSSMP